MFLKIQTKWIYNKCPMETDPLFEILVAWLHQMASIDASTKNSNNDFKSNSCSTANHVIRGAGFSYAWIKWSKGIHNERKNVLTGEYASEFCPLNMQRPPPLNYFHFFIDPICFPSEPFLYETISPQRVHSYFARISALFDHLQIVHDLSTSSKLIPTFFFFPSTFMVPIEGSGIFLFFW